MVDVRLVRVLENKMRATLLWRHKALMHRSNVLLKLFPDPGSVAAAFLEIAIQSPEKPGAVRTFDKNSAGEQFTNRRTPEQPESIHDYERFRFH